MEKRIASLILTASLLSFNLFSQNKADDIIGIWLTGVNEPAKIQIYGFGRKFYGKIIWLKNPTENGRKRVDGNNPDKSKQNSEIIGLVKLTDFKFDGDDEWKSCNIYDPEGGKTYSSYIHLKDKNTLRVRGYVGISLFDRTETWTRSN